MTALEEAERHIGFLAACAPAGHSHIELRAKTPTGGMAQDWHTDPAAAAAEAVRMSAMTDVFVGVAPRKSQAGGAEAIDMVGVLWADCDDEAASAALETFDVPPSLTVATSPGRTHAYWALAEPIPAAQAEALNRRLAAALGADAKCTDRARILRAAGTTH